jgi:hypothetical protein
MIGRLVFLWKWAFFPLERAFYMTKISWDTSLPHQLFFNSFARQKNICFVFHSPHLSLSLLFWSIQNEYISFLFCVCFCNIFQFTDLVSDKDKTFRIPYPFNFWILSFWNVLPFHPWNPEPSGVIVDPKK